MNVKLYNILKLVSKTCTAGKVTLPAMAVRNASLLPRRLEHVHCAYSTHLHFVAASRRTFDEIQKKLGSLTLFKNDWRKLSEPHLPTTQLSGLNVF